VIIGDVAKAGSEVSGKEDRVINTGQLAMTGVISDAACHYVRFRPRDDIEEASQVPSLL
jgi:hypothetical protein